MKQFPKVRKEKLIVQQFKDELLVYDKQSHKAHCLNGTAALVWKRCDGRTSVTEISRRLGKEMEGEAVVDERLVWYALKQFERDHLLEEKLDIPARMMASVGAGINRRRMIKVLGLAAVVAVPLVTSMAAPHAGDAVSCLGPGATCTTSVQCCNGLCNGGTCN
jgi:hypothetical protein